MAGVTGGWNMAFRAERGRPRSASVASPSTLALVVLAQARSHGSAEVFGQRHARGARFQSASVSIRSIRRLHAARVRHLGDRGRQPAALCSISNFISPEFPSFSRSCLLVVMLKCRSRARSDWRRFGRGALELLATLGQYRLLFVGVLMLAVLRLAPTGLVGLIASVLPRKERDTLAKERSDIGRFLAAGASGQALAVRDLSVNFGGVRAVRDLTLEAQPGAITSIIGPNGAGKSTALNVICGFYRPDAGTVRLGDQIVSALRAYQIPRAGIARTYQTSQLFESMSVIDNVVIALRRGRLAPHFLTGGKHGDEAEIAESLLAFVGYRGALERPADALAHVDKRLVEIARALCQAERACARGTCGGLNAEDTAAIGALLRELCLPWA
jgi:ABC-type branched-subunit amino acid transport system ATPase component